MRLQALLLSQDATTIGLAKMSKIVARCHSEKNRRDRIRLYLLHTQYIAEFQHPDELQNWDKVNPNHFPPVAADQILTTK